MKRICTIVLCLVVLCQFTVLSFNHALGMRFTSNKASVFRNIVRHTAPTLRVSTRLQANPRRMDVGEGQPTFSSELVKHELLTIEDEMELARQYKIGMQILAQTKQLQSTLDREATLEDVGASLEIDAAQVLNLLRKMETAKKILVKTNMRLVFHIARYYKNRGVTYPDLVQEGTFGLIKSIEKYDPSKGFRFSTYASWWIKQAVSRCIAEKSRLIRLPVHIHDMMVSIARVEKQFISEHSRKPTAQEIAERLALPLAKVQVLLKNTVDVNSIDESAFQNRGKIVMNDVQVKDRLASDGVREPTSVSVGSSLREELRRALSGLTDREAQVLILRFGLNGDTPYTLDDIGKKFAVTRERIRQIEARALSKMRHPAKKSELQEIFQESAVFASFPSKPTATSAATSTSAASSHHTATTAAAGVTRGSSSSSSSVGGASNSAGRSSRATPQVTVAMEYSGPLSPDFESSAVAPTSTAAVIPAGTHNHRQGRASDWDSVGSAGDIESESVDHHVDLYSSESAPRHSSGKVLASPAKEPVGTGAFAF